MTRIPEKPIASRQRRRQGSRHNKYIYAYGFLRNTEHVTNILFAFDYDEGYEELFLLLVLQDLKDIKEGLYIGEGYRDYIEEETLENLNKLVDGFLERKGNYLFLTRDAFSIKKFIFEENRFIMSLSNKRDERDQHIQMLIEEGESKWK